MTERLTDRAITAKKPADRAVLIFDTEITGLAVKVHPSGFKSFVFIWHEAGRQRRTTLGKFPVWSIGKARTHAGRMRLKADVGETVNPGRSGKVSDLIEQWKEVVKLTRRPSTVKSYLRLIDRRIVPEFGKGEPRGVTRNGVELWHGRIAETRPIEANRALAVLSSFMSWLEHDKRIADNPCHGVRRRPENQRQVFLTAEQIAAAHKALSDENEERSAALALRMALLTGARIGEVLNLIPEQIDVAHKLWIKLAASTKQKKLHIVPLQAEALAVANKLLQLNQMPQYHTCRLLWERVRMVIGRSDVRVHDLRHSRASALARQKASLPQIGRVLGHTSPQTTQRYAHLVATDLADLIEAAD